MAIETRCIIRCDSCGRFIDAVIKLRPAPAPSNEYLPLTVVRLYPAAVGPVEIKGPSNWKIDSSGRVLCPHCPNIDGPYR